MNLLPALILGFTMLARMSWYDPSLCNVKPVNCYNPAEWYKMAGGADARDWFNRATACPEVFPIGTAFHIEGSRYGLADGDWTCLDRGGRVVIGKDGAVLDLLRHTPVWSESLIVQVEFPHTLTDEYDTDPRPHHTDY